MSPKRLPACMDEAAQFSRHSPTSGSPDRTQKPWVPDRVRIDCITDPCAPINRSGWLRAGLKAAIWLSALMTVGYGLLVGGMTQAAGLLAISEGRLPPLQLQEQHERVAIEDGKKKWAAGTPLRSNLSGTLPPSAWATPDPRRHP